MAAASLVVGLVFSHFWLRHEHRLLGPTAPPRAFRVPRPAGAIMGIVAFAVLGFGVGFLFKGARYLIFNPPTLANLRWANLLGMTPRDVGIVFAFGGLVVAVLGAVLWRAARAFGRARVHEVLTADPRPPVLYLRSFADDSVPLPIIASARRPLFELFSVRGADPFEECVAWELDSYGPVVAVGRPGGRLASLGAAREHLSNDTWHVEIESRMSDAGWIALAPGDTDGLAWELEAIVSGGHLHKTIFVFPPLAPAELDRRWTHTSRGAARRGRGHRRTSRAVQRGAHRPVRSRRRPVGPRHVGVHPRRSHVPDGGRPCARAGRSGRPGSGRVGRRAPPPTEAGRSRVDGAPALLR